MQAPWIVSVLTYYVFDTQESAEAYAKELGEEAYKAQLPSLIAVGRPVDTAIYSEIIKKMPIPVRYDS